MTPGGRPLPFPTKFAFTPASRLGVRSTDWLLSVHSLMPSACMRRVNLFIIGVNKAGTSWLYHLLDHHPDVFMSDVKELYFFGTAQEGPPDLEAYHRYFPFEESYRYFGEATVMYYREKTVAAQLYEYNPNATLLAIVRDPVDRLLSQYRYHKQLGLIDEDASLADALDGTALLHDSHYEKTLPPFAEQFGSDRFHVVSLEEARREPARFWEELLHFLELPHVPRPRTNSKPENPTGSSAFRRVYRTVVQPIKHHLPNVYEWMLQSSAVRQAKLRLLRLLGTADPEPLPPDLRERLREEFAPTYDYLQDLGFEAYNESNAASRSPS